MKSLIIVLLLAAIIKGDYIWMKSKELYYNYKYKKYFKNIGI